MINFPARVIVVDDQRRDAVPLLCALRDERIPSLYYTGRISDLPSKPLEGVRVVFLDIRLQNMDGQPIKTVVSNLIGVMRKIIGKANGPYFVIVWTKHPDEFDQVSDGLKQLACPPILSLSLIKQACKAPDGVKYDLQKIQDGIKDNMGKIGAAKLLLRWEELVRLAAGKVSAEICSIPGSVPENVALLFHKLANASGGKATEDLNETELAREAVSAMQSMLSDTLDREIYASEDLQLQKPATASSPGFDVDNLNAKLLLGPTPASGNRPGTIFALCEEDPLDFQTKMIERLLNDSVLKSAQEYREYLNSLPPGSTTNETSKPSQKEVDSKANLQILQRLEYASVSFSVVLTPYCDHGQKKNLRNQVCSGMFWPKDLESKLKKNASFLYVTPAVRPTPSEPAFLIVIDLGTITSCISSRLTTPVVSLRRELVLDIQSHLGRHLSRPGITSAK